MSDKIRCSINQLPGLLAKRMRRLDGRMRETVFQSAIAGSRIVRKRTPKAFGELQESVQAYRRGKSGNPVISVDAPHAGPVEIGSRPHNPDMEALVRWVKLRGMQGLTSRGTIKSRFGRNAGTTTRFQAMRVARLIRGERASATYRRPTILEHRQSFFVEGKVTPNRIQASGQFTPIDAAHKVAEKIAAGIREHGTKPHWFVRSSIPELGADLLKRLTRTARTT